MFQQHQQVTEQFTRDLIAEDLLVANSTTLTLANGRNIELAGFQMIDEEKFLKLPDEKHLEFKKKGWLPYIYFTLMSTSNWKQLGDIASIREG